jgi:hypothetical protein
MKTSIERPGVPRLPKTRKHANQNNSDLFCAAYMSANFFKDDIISAEHINQVKVIQN